MAEKTDSTLAVLYAPCYLDPTCHSHATSVGLERGLIETEEKVTYRDESPEEARQALILGHNLIVRVLDLQNNYFRLELDAEVNARLAKFVEIWGKGPEI